MNVIKHEDLITILGIPIRDTVVMTWIMMALIVVIVLILRKKIPHLLELLFDLIYGIVDSVLDVENLTPYLPLLGSLFIFVLSANWLSIIPGLSSPTSDVNTTFALALIVFFSVHFYGIKTHGVIGYLKAFSDPVFLFPLELISHFSRTLSLTLRLFGNILSGDIIVAIVFSLIPLIVPLPLIALGMFSGALQAFILTTLASLYVSSAVVISKNDEKAREKNKLQPTERKA
ncbi:MAG: F0F1 ATP synthase subunit A [Chloroflexi bacterium]|jgi:F-type H+-transporting ATPase subunit a|nr:F0F1 ATP synthase subunit A [Chloroflexota bacterium]